MGDREHGRQKAWETESMGDRKHGRRDYWQYSTGYVVDSAHQCSAVDGSTIGSVHGHRKLQSLTLRTVM